MNKKSGFSAEYESGTVTDSKSENDVENIQALDTPLVEPDAERYGTGKPRREVVTARIIHD